MKTTFINAASSKEARKALRIAGMSHLKSRQEDFEGYMEYGTEAGEVSADNVVLETRIEEFFKQTGTFYDYGLNVDYVVPGTFEKQTEGYLRYQLSYGGPGEEIRFYHSPGSRSAYKIIFVYLDWYVGVGFDVTNEEWAVWLFKWFEEVGTLEAEREKALNNS